MTKYILITATALLLGGCNLSAAQSIIDHAPSCSDPAIVDNLTAQMLDKLKQIYAFVGEPTGKVKDIFTISHEQYTATCLATFELTAALKNNDGTSPGQKTTESDVGYTAIVSDDGKTNRVGIK